MPNVGEAGVLWISNLAFRVPSSGSLFLSLSLHLFCLLIISLSLEMFNVGYDRESGLPMRMIADVLCRSSDSPDCRCIDANLLLLAKSKQTATADDNLTLW